MNIIIAATMILVVSFTSLVIAPDAIDKTIANQDNIADNHKLMLKYGVYDND